tara:strand:+ start:55 stop:312 length:258 start_codon:yes stop_codon:yes gene_type:complete
MELIELKHTEETDKYHLFTITVKTRSFWGKEKTVLVDCAREVGESYNQAYDIRSGERLYHRWIRIDSAISAILSTESKCYKKNEV